MTNTTKSLVALSFITKCEPSGGATIYAVQMAKTLLTAGYESHLVYGCGDRTKGISTRNLGKLRLIKSRYLRREPGLSDIFFIVETLILMHKLKPDIIITHSFKACLLVRLAHCVKISRNARLFQVVHGFSFSDTEIIRKQIYFFMERALQIIKHSTIFVCNSNLEDYKAHVKPRNKLYIIPPFAKSPRPEISKKAKGTYQHQVYIRMCTAARLEQQKNLNFMINIMSKLPERYTLDIYGDGSKLSELVDLVERYDLISRCRFMGKVPHGSIPYSEYKVFILTSQWEGLPLSLLEAMSYAVPIVASDVGGISQLFLSRQPGLLMKTWDENIWANSLIVLLENREAYEQAAEQAHNTWQTCYSLDSFERKVYALLNGKRAENAKASQAD